MHARVNAVAAAALWEMETLSRLHGAEVEVAQGELGKALKGYREAVAVGAVVALREPETG